MSFDQRILRFSNYLQKFHNSQNDLVTKLKKFQEQLTSTPDAMERFRKLKYPPKANEYSFESDLGTQLLVNEDDVDIEDDELESTSDSDLEPELCKRTCKRKLDHMKFGNSFQASIQHKFETVDDSTSNQAKEKKICKVMRANEKMSFWKCFKQNPSTQFGQEKYTFAINGKDELFFAHQSLDKYISNFAGAILITSGPNYSANIVTTDFQSLYPSVTILNNIDSSSLALWSEFKIYIWGLNINVDPFDERYIRKEACQIKVNESYLQILIFFIRPNIVQSLTSKLHISLGEERAKIKNIMKGKKNMSLSEYQYYDASQLAIKCIMNSIYGASGSKFYCCSLMYISSEITKKGRNQIFSLFMYSYWYCFQRNLNGVLNVVYGDTDSLFSNFKDSKEFPTEYFVRLAYEYMRYPALKSLYDKDVNILEEYLSEVEYKKLVEKRWDLDKITFYNDYKVVNWVINQEKRTTLNFVEENFNLERYQNICQLISNNEKDKWKTIYHYLAREPRPFDRSILIYIQNDILHKFSLLKKNRILLPGKSWSDLVYSEPFFIGDEFIGAENIDQVSQQIIIVKLENLIRPFFLFKLKNYIGSTDEGIYSHGGLLFNSRQPIPTKNVICAVWKIFQKPIEKLDDTSINCIKNAFKVYEEWDYSYFFLSFKIGRKLDDYKNESVPIFQLKTINRLGLERLDIGDVVCMSFFNFFFQGEFIGEKVDKNNPEHLKVLNKRRQSTLLIQNLVEQVQMDITDKEIEAFKSCLTKEKLDDYEKRGLLLGEAKKFYFKFGIKQLALDKELILYKNIKAPICSFMKTINNQSLYFLDFQEQFELIWFNHFNYPFNRTKQQLNTKKMKLKSVDDLKNVLNFGKILSEKKKMEKKKELFNF